MGASKPMEAPDFSFSEPTGIRIKMLVLLAG